MKVDIGPFPKKGKRKIKIRVDSYDTWSLDSTLAYVIVVALKQMKKDNNGIPSAMFDKSYDKHRKGESQKSHSARLRKAEAIALKKWYEIFDKMIWSFEQINKDYQIQYYSGRSDIKWVVTKETKDLPEAEQLEKMEKGPKDTFKVDYKGLEKHETRIQEGIDLFAKHFRSFWT